MPVYGVLRVLKGTNLLKTHAVQQVEEIQTKNRNEDGILFPINFRVFSVQTLIWQTPGVLAPPNTKHQSSSSMRHMSHDGAYTSGSIHPHSQNLVSKFSGQLTVHLETNSVVSTFVWLSGSLRPVTRQTCFEKAGFINGSGNEMTDISASYKTGGYTFPST